MKKNIAKIKIEKITLVSLQKLMKVKGGVIGEPNTTLILDAWSDPDA